jgi:HEAT repeat protein
MTLCAGQAIAEGAIARRVSEAYLQCADRVAARGDKQSALRVYKELAAAKETPLVRVGALTGMANAGPKEAIAALAPEIESKDERIQLAAIRLLTGIPGDEVTGILHRAYANLTPHGKMRLLGALADRGDKSSRETFLAAAKDTSPGVSAAGLRGLGTLGDVSSIAVLAEAAATGQPAGQAAARQALKTMSGAQVDAALISAMASSKGKVRAELISAAGERGATAAADAVVSAIQDTDPDVHREALRAAKNVAGSQQVPALVSLIGGASKAPDRREIGVALASALQRSDPGRIAAVIGAYRSATALETRVALIETLGRISSAEALAVLREGLADSSPEIVRASILALSDWGDAAPLPDLLAVAKNSGNPAFQVLALRGYLKLVSVPSTRPYAESARLLASAAPLAKDAAEKRTLLSLLPNYPCPESMQLAESMMKDEAVATEAKVALERLKSGAGAPRNRGPQR